MMLRAVIISMQRSGSSAFARAAHHGGLDMGESLLPADIVNPRGYYEDKRFLELCKEILEVNKYGDLSLSQFLKPLIVTSDLEYRCLKYILHHEAPQGLKCPLILGSWPVWSKIFPSDMFYIIIRRDRESALRSLERLVALRRKQGRQTLLSDRQIETYYDLCQSRINLIEATVRRVASITFDDLFNPTAQRHISEYLCPELEIERIAWDMITSPEHVEHERKAGQWL